jgi:hypothetical protein
MNSLSNIWQHPRTSAAGLLISTLTVAGVLSQQGVTLGKVGNGTAVSLAGALATALLGLMAQDPAPQAQAIPEAAAASSGAGNIPLSK